jgi:hypothetical protein
MNIGEAPSIGHPVGHPHGFFAKAPGWANEQPQRGALGSVALIWEDLAPGFSRGYYGILCLNC